MNSPVGGGNLPQRSHMLSSQQSKRPKQKKFATNIEAMTETMLATFK
jgi:hypothetical protein